MSVEVTLIVKKEIELEKNSIIFSKEGSLTNEKKNSLKNFKKKLKEHSKRYRKYNITYDLDYLFKELMNKKDSTNQ